MSPHVQAEDDIQFRHSGQTKQGKIIRRSEILLYKVGMCNCELYCSVFILIKGKLFRHKVSSFILWLMT